MRRVLTRVLPSLCGALAVAGGVSACGEKSDTINAPAGSAQPFTLMLDYTPNADHVGLYEAIANGDFSAAGLNVKVQVPSDPAEPLKLVADGQVDAAISYEPEVLLARSAGTPVVAVAAIVQKPLTSIISVGSKNITTPADLAGKTIGTAGIPYQNAYLQTILQAAGVASTAVKIDDVGFNLVPAMVSGRVDATIGGYSTYEAIQLQQAGKKPNVIPVDQAGVPTYDELVLVVRKGTIIDKTSLLRRFVQALGRGYQQARADPTGAVDNLLKYNPTLPRKLEAASVKAVMADFFPPAGHPWGYMNGAQWYAFGQWMLQHKLISNPQNEVLTDASDNELLAGQGLPVTK